MHGRPHQTTIIVSDEQIGLRADMVVAQHYLSFTRSALRRLFEDRLVRLNGEPVKAGQKMRFGDMLHVQDEQLRSQPGNLDLPVIYEDDDVIVINKPVGILSHSKGALNEEATVASFIRPKVAKPLEGNRAGIVHRLDRATSGVMIAAKTPEAQQWLQKQFAQRRTKKTYVAIVKGEVAPDEAIIDIPIERNPASPKSFRPSANGKPAQTAFKVLLHNGHYTMLELKPVTGRTHQLRVHLQHLGHPIVGDQLYGGETASRLFLHAQHLELTLPNGVRKVYSAKLPQLFNEFMEVNHGNNAHLASSDDQAGR